MKAYSGRGGIAPLILSPALDKGEWLASRPGRLTPQKRTPLPSYYEAGWAPEAAWTMWRKENSLALPWIRTQDRSIRSVVTIPMILLLLHLPIASALNTGSIPVPLTIGLITLY